MTTSTIGMAGLVKAAVSAVLAGACLWAAPAAVADQADDIRAARQAVVDRDWARAVASWERLSLVGVPEAPGALCRLYFDARQGVFDADRAVDQCGRAAATGDAGALYRSGLLYLVGLGVEQNADQTQALCSAALAADSRVPARFCLAAALHEKNRQDEAVLRPPPVPAAAPPDAANGGPEPRLQCERAFAGSAAEYDVAGIERACARAAEAGDPAAEYRLGLMALTGLGQPRDLDSATAHCAQAQRDSDGDISAAFCVAAAARMRQNAARLALSRATGSLDADPTTGQALPKTHPDPFALDRFLDTPRTTATGLSYTCRQISEWGLFEAPDPSVVAVRDPVFGRRLVDYRPADYQALDLAAAACETGVATIDPRRAAVAATDPNRADMLGFRQFRQSLPALQARQKALLAEVARSLREATPPQPATARR